jgi:hypothetical protein
MAYHPADCFGRSFYVATPEYKVEPATGGFAVVTMDWFRRGDETDFTTTTHYRAATAAECQIWIDAARQVTA